jgi:hypothetical protein
MGSLRTIQSESIKEQRESLTRLHNRLLTPYEFLENPEYCCLTNILPEKVKYYVSQIVSRPLPYLNTLDVKRVYESYEIAVWSLIYKAYAICFSKEKVSISSTSCFLFNTGSSIYDVAISLIESSPWFRDKIPQRRPSYLLGFRDGLSIPIINANSPKNILGRDIFCCIDSGSNVDISEFIISRMRCIDSSFISPLYIKIIDS